VNQRERLMAFLNNEPVDRVPIWLLFPYHRYGAYADVHSIPQYRPIIDLALDMAVWLNRRSFRIPLYEPQVKIWNEEEKTDSGFIQRQIVAYGDIRLTKEVCSGPAGKFIKKHLANEGDLDAFMNMPFLLDEKLIIKELEPKIALWRREAAEFPRHLGAMMNDLGEPIGVIYNMAELDELSVWSITAARKIETLLDKLMIRYRTVYRHLLEQDVGEVFFLVGSELASPPMVSRKTFQRWIVPYAKELINMVHSYGKKVIQHYHGQIKEILPDFLEMAPDALHTIESPPTGNCTLTEAFNILGDRIGIIGNIQYDEFRRLTPAQMDRTVRTCLEECRGRRFMLSPTAGPYEPVISERQRDNYVQFLRSGWQYGRVNP